MSDMSKMFEKGRDEEDLARVTSTTKTERTNSTPYYTQDAVFGEITEAGPNYRNVRT